MWMSLTLSLTMVEILSGLLSFFMLFGPDYGLGLKTVFLKIMSKLNRDRGG